MDLVQADGRIALSRHTLKMFQRHGPPDGSRSAGARIIAGELEALTAIVAEFPQLDGIVSELAAEWVRVKEL
jgi:hypothetical protein